jgi:hypothetical protein
MHANNHDINCHPTSLTHAHELVTYPIMSPVHFHMRFQFIHR